jgi:hypothetical protein
MSVRKVLTPDFSSLKRSASPEKAQNSRSFSSTKLPRFTPYRNRRPINVIAIDQPARDPNTIYVEHFLSSFSPFINSPIFYFISPFTSIRVEFVSPRKKELLHLHFSSQINPSIREIPYKRSKTNEPTRL